MGRVGCLVIACACSRAVGTSAVRTAPRAPPSLAEVEVRFTGEPEGAEELGIVESHGPRPAATLQELMERLKAKAGRLGADVVRVDSFATQYEIVPQDFTYDCSTTETHQEPRTTMMMGPDGLMTTATEFVTVTQTISKT